MTVRDGGDVWCQLDSWPVEKEHRAFEAVTCTQ